LAGAVNSEDAGEIPKGPDRGMFRREFLRVFSYRKSGGNSQSLVGEYVCGDCNGNNGGNGFLRSDEQLI